MQVDVELEQLARRYLDRVKRSGPSNVMARCPFHVKADGSEEKNPSFAFSLSTGLYICFSCHEKGNLRSFLRGMGLTHENIDRQFGYLLEQVRSNLPAPNDPTKPKMFGVPRVEESLLGLFEYCPNDLIESGFTPDTLRHFDVGYDFWHGRITYPLRNLHGDLIGVMGRNTTGPKYKVYTTEYKLWNLSEKAEVDKRFVLWNSDKVYPELYFQSAQEPIIVVEGFKACMWMWQAGFKNVVALLGSYMSYEHKWILERIGAPVYLFLDNNRAGRTGAIKAAEQLSKSLRVSMVTYPDRLIGDEDAQPDNCAPEELRDMMATAPSYLTWLFKHLKG